MTDPSRDVTPILKPERRLKSKHNPRCLCPQCTGERAARAGLKAQRHALKAVAAATGTAVKYAGALSNEETAQLRNWQVEVKHTGVAPALVRRAFSQAENAIAIGSQRKPAVVIDPADSPSLVVLRMDDFLELLEALRAFAENV